MNLTAINIIFLSCTYDYYYHTTFPLMMQVKTFDDKVQQIVEMGFGEADARKALEKCKGDSEAACNMLLSNL